MVIAVNKETKSSKDPNALSIAFPRSLSDFGTTPPPSEIGARLRQKNS